MWEWISTQEVDKVANAIIALLAAIAVFLGLKKPAQEPGPRAPPPTMEVATDFFDAEAIGSLTREVTGAAVAATGITVAKKDQTDAIKAQTQAMNRLCDLAAKWIEDQEEAEERRLERRAEIAELDAERLRRENEELNRRLKMDPMRKD
ncbi:hypothetical protein [Aureimonas glaciei]|uniref:Uncharacterized protein n=1 Tax=Aureimonas glaciei TaxID=1776957 RepID=A0A916Y3B2_9HYPH|nr:hypothetical protein [Aureimonas glaciei]GGD29156.1 hypothetical protein GCM10011335_35370 [Aureimonas glaciei]